MQQKKFDIGLIIGRDPEIAIDIVRVENVSEFLNKYKKIPLANSVFFNFAGNRDAARGKANISLAKIYAALTHFTGPSDECYDDFKGSYSFIFELTVEKNNKVSKYYYHLIHCRSYMDFTIYQIVPDSDPRDACTLAIPDDELFSEKDMLSFSNCFYEYMLQRMKEENYTPESFVKYSESALLVFGYSDEIHDYFIEKYDDVEKFNKRIKLEKVEGVTVDEAKGKAEGEMKAKKEIVLRMHSKNINTEDMAEIVSLSITEVEAIIAEN